MEQTAKPRVLFFAMLAITDFVFFAIYLACPSIRHSLAEEGMYIEMATALSFLVSGVIGFVALCMKWSNRARPVHAVLVVLFFMGFLDEMDYGTEILNVEPYYLFGNHDYEIDAVHDVVSVSCKLFRDHAGPTGYVIGSLIFASLIAALFIKRRSYMPWVMVKVRKYPAFDYFRLALIIAIPAMLLDLDVAGKKYADLAQFFEELIELNVAIAMLFAARAIHDSRRIPTCPDTPL